MEKHISGKKTDENIPDKRGEKNKEKDKNTNSGKSQKQSRMKTTPTAPGDYVLIPEDMDVTDNLPLPLRSPPLTINPDISEFSINFTDANVQNITSLPK